MDYNTKEYGTPEESDYYLEGYKAHDDAKGWWDNPYAHEDYGFDITAAGLWWLGWASARR